MSSPKGDISEPQPQLATVSHSPPLCTSSWKICMLGPASPISSELFLPCYSSSWEPGENGNASPPEHQGKGSRVFSTHPCTKPQVRLAKSKARELPVSPGCCSRGHSKSSGPVSQRSHGHSPGLLHPSHTPSAASGVKAAPSSWKILT